MYCEKQNKECVFLQDISDLSEFGLVLDAASGAKNMEVFGRVLQDESTEWISNALEKCVHDYCGVFRLVVVQSLMARTQDRFESGRGNN